MRSRLLRKERSAVSLIPVLSQESSRRASARRKDSSQPKDLVWLDPCDKHRDEGEKGRTQHVTTKIFHKAAAHSWQNGV
ncbi:hypothetical protein DXT95_04110 [Agrobacterium tumefaciens]|nr:hypothetical protein [Agrobacterium tumefaciens]